MAPINYRPIKSAALARNPTLGIPRAYLVPNTTTIDPRYRGRIVEDVHRTLNMLARSGYPVPRFLTHDADGREDYRGINALLGVEGFLLPARHASYNDLQDVGFSGIFQFGPNTFGHHAGKIAERLNAILGNPALRDSQDLSSLRTAIAESGLDRGGNFTFNTDNIWHFHNNPMVQTVAAVLHHGERLNRIQGLGPEGRPALITRDQQIGLFTISHNIPALSNLIMDELTRGGDRPVTHVSVSRYGDMMRNNPALYNGTTSLRNILDQVAAYARDKAEQMRGFGQVGQLAAAHTPREIREADRERLNQIVREAVEGERRRPGIPQEGRDMLGRLIEALDRQEVQDNRERGYEIRREQPRGGNPDDIIRDRAGVYRTRAAVESDERTARGEHAPGPAGPPAGDAIAHIIRTGRPPAASR